MIYIDGIGISGYRGFGPDVVRIGPFRKLNLFIGKNNVGKSTVLHFIQHKYKKTVHDTRLRLEGTDIHHGLHEGYYAFDLAVKIGGPVFEKILERFPKANGKIGEFRDRVASFLQESGIVDEKQTAWFCYAPNDTGPYVPEWFNDIYAKKGTLGFGRLYELLHRTSQAGTPTVKVEAKLKQLLNDLGPHHVQVKTTWPVKFIPAVREAQVGRAPFGYNGVGIAQELLSLKQPTGGHPRKRAKYDQVV